MWQPVLMKAAQCLHVRLAHLQLSAYCGCCKYSVMAAGGIVDVRGVRAAVAGAEGVCRDPVYRFECPASNICKQDIIQHETDDSSFPGIPTYWRSTHTIWLLNAKKCMKKVHPPVKLNQQ